VKHIHPKKGETSEQEGETHEERNGDEEDTNATFTVEIPSKVQTTMRKHGPDKEKHASTVKTASTNRDNNVSTTER
jgi:hypothetical protein